ncbi:MAG TPA: TetR/AcrR family transcriptional regulator [archaeon]|nr:TetR/AcrR family transcriptional regulator [archaeon]
MAAGIRKEQKKRTRELLIECALQEFSQKGISATTTVDIAKAAGVAHGTVFVHFPTRDDLLIRVISDFGLLIGSEFKKLSRQEGGVRDILAAHLKIIERYEPFYTQLVIEGALLPRDARNTIFLIQSGIARYLEEALARDVQKKLVRSLPIHLLLNTWIGTLNYYLANRDKFAPGKSVIAAHGQELLNHFISTIELKKKEG